MALIKCPACNHEVSDQATSECGTVFFKDEKGITPIPQRIQMIVAFSMIDVLANYWFSYLGRTGTTGERPREWYQEFCCTTDNKKYTGLFKDLSWDTLYKFRNALVHFFGFGEPADELFIALAANDLSDSRKAAMEKAFLAKNHKTIMLRPFDFFNLVREGTILMLLSWADTIKAAQTEPEREIDHIEGIRRVWDKVQKEGAKGMSREQAGL